MVAADSSFLSLLLNPNSKVPTCPSSGAPISHWKERVQAAVEKHSRDGDVLLVPTPCLTEIATAVPNTALVVSAIERSSAFKIAPFDAKAAIDLAEANKEALNSGNKRGDLDGEYQKIKLDRQIVVIAKSAGCKVFYTDDKNQTKFAKQQGLKVVHSWELDLPESARQVELFTQE